MTQNSESEAAMPVLSTMPAERVAEIAVLLQVHRYRSVGMRDYMAMLQMDAEALGIADGEMFDFFKAILDRIRVPKKDS